MEVTSVRAEEKGKRDKAMKNLRGNTNITINTDLIDLARTADYQYFDEYQLHCHSSYELYYFISGDVKYMVEGKLYTPSPKSILLLKPGAIHGVINNSQELYFRYAFHFYAGLVSAELREALFSPFYGDSIYFEQVDLIDSFDKVLASWEMPKQLRSLVLSCRFQSLLTELLPLSQVPPQQLDQLAYRIILYINDNLAGNLSLDAISHAFFMSKSQLNRIFKSSLNITIGNYIALKRSAYARELLLRGKSAAEAAAASGFKDYSTFYRTYRKQMGHSPASVQFRDRE